MLCLVFNFQTVVEICEVDSGGILDDLLLRVEFGAASANAFEEIAAIFGSFAPFFCVQER